MSALNQSKEGWDWNNVHMRSSFQDVRKSSACPLVSGKFSCPMFGSIGRIVASGTPVLTVVVVTTPAWIRGLHSPIRVVHRRCRRLMNLFSETSSEMPSVTSCKSWKSCASDVPTTLQKTTKKGHNGYESMVLIILAGVQYQVLGNFLPSKVRIIALNEVTEGF
jgi:hypothetical protein